MVSGTAPNTKHRHAPHALRTARHAPLRETRSICPYCGVGCGVIIESQGPQITGVRGDPDHPANFGRLCSKGASLHHTASHTVTLQTRLLQPLQRATRDAAPQAIGWDKALDLATERFARTIAAHGPDAVGFYISGQLLTEDYYVFNKLAKGLLGTNNIDTNSRLCMSSAVAGYKQTLGADAPPRLLRRPAARAVPVHHRQQHGLGAPGAVSPHRGRPAQQPATQDHRGRPTPHRHGRNRRPAPGPAAWHRCASARRHAAPDAARGLAR